MIPYFVQGFGADNRPCHLEVFTTTIQPALVSIVEGVHSQQLEFGDVSVEVGRGLKRLL